MSTSDLYRVYRTRATHFAELRNGWGSAPVLWRHLVVRFLGREQHDYLRSGGNDSELWDLARDPRVPVSLRLAHAFCCDQAVCPVDRLKELAEACERVYEVTANSQGVNHWQSIAALLREHKPRARQIGVGLSCTSVCDPWSGWKPQNTQAVWDIFPYVERERAAA